MRTRSGSLAAVMARVPSHPAHSGVLCICAANASSRSGSRRRIPRVQHGRRTASTEFASPAALQIQGLVGVRSSASPPRASILALVLERWSSPTVMAAMRTRPLALLPCCSMATGMPKHSCWSGPRCSITTASRPARDHSTALSAPLRSSNNATGFSNNAVGDSALFRNQSGAAEYRCW